MTRVINTGADAPSGILSPKMIPRGLDGFPNSNLIAHYLMNDQTPSGGISDSVSGQKHSVTGAGTITSTGTAGGVAFGGAKSLSTSPVDMLSVWTVCLSFLLPRQAIANPAHNLISIGAFGASGLTVWGQWFTTPPAGDKIPVWFQASNAGALLSQKGPMDLGGAVLDSTCEIMVSYDGVGGILIAHRRGNTESIIKYAVTATGLTGSTGVDRYLPVKIGGYGPYFDKLSITADALSVYGKAFNADEFTAWSASARLLATSRGRT